MNNIIERPRMSLSMIDNIGESRETIEAYAGVIRYFFGEPGTEFLEGLQSGSLTVDSRHSYRPRINEFYFNKIAQAYNLPEHYITPQSSFIQAGNTAINVVRHQAELSGLSIANDPLVDEISPNPSSPTDILYYLSLDRSGESVHLEFNARRHFIILSIAQEIEANSGNGAVQGALSDLQFLFNKNLYKGGEKGLKVPYEKFSRHDVQTNTFIDFLEDPSKILFESARILRNTFSTRQLQDSDDLVYTKSRKKDPVAATEKTIANAHDTDGIIKPEDVEDLAGIEAVVIEGDRPRTEDEKKARIERIHNRYIQVIREGGLLDEDKVMPDDKVGNNRGQGLLDWKRSKLSVLSRTSVLIELITTGEGNYLNQTYEIGILDPETHLYTGQAHGLYTIRRDSKVAPHILLGSMYQNYNVQRGLSSRSRIEADRLINSREVVRTSDHQRDYI